MLLDERLRHSCAHRHYDGGALGGSELSLAQNGERIHHILETICKSRLLFGNENADGWLVELDLISNVEGVEEVVVVLLDEALGPPAGHYWRHLI